MNNLQALRTRVKACRVCGSNELEIVLDLGDMAFAGWFPTPNAMAAVPWGPLTVLKCAACSLVQLAHDFSAPMLYGANYGYRSGLNAGMVAHLRDVAERAKALRNVSTGDVVVDIGGNDGTLLGNFPAAVTRINIDPTLCKFAAHNAPGIIQVPEFFSREALMRASNNKAATLIFSISMFYDLPKPVEFAQQVAACLAPEGLWVIEVASLALQVVNNAFDVFCHEHTEYYSLETLLGTMHRAGLRPVELAFNETNGGSMRVTFCHVNAAWPGGLDLAEEFALERAGAKLTEKATWSAFAERITQICAFSKVTLQELKARGRSVAGIGASTKGNVLLQAAGIGPDLLPCIGEVNAEKFGKVTPGTGIPIASEAEVLAAKPDVLFILPWHFRNGMIARFEEYLKAGGLLFLPLPVPQWVVWTGDTAQSTTTEPVLN